MEWTLFALLQMFIITVAVSLACWMRMRSAQQQNEQLREHIEDLTENSAGEGDGSADAPSPEAWLSAQIDQLAAEDAATPFLKLALQHILQPVDDIQSALHEVVQQAGFASGADGGDHAERIAELEAALEAAKAAADSGAEGEDAGRTEELKTLLQQFTRDSREMMACIQTLEAENAQLREQLGDDAPAPQAEQPSEQAAEAAATENAEDTAEDAA